MTEKSFGPHALPAIEPPTPWTAAPTPRKVQEWLGHANASTPRPYDRHRSRAEDSPVFRVAY